MRRPSLLRLSPLALACLLAACGGGGSDAVKDAGDRPSTFPTPTPPTNDFEENTSGDNTNLQSLDRNEVRVSVDVPALLAPEAPQVRRNLRRLTGINVRAIRLDSGGQIIGTLQTTQRTDTDGSLILSFEGYPDIPPLELGITLEAELPGGQVLRAPVADADRDIKINPFSDYLVSDALTQLNAETLDRIDNCDTAAQLCFGKVLWPALVDQIQDFEIDIPANLDLVQAKQLLQSRPDFTRYANALVDLLKQPQETFQAVGGVARNFNTVFYALELSGVPDGNKTLARWGNRLSTVQINTDATGGQGYIYPGISLTSFDVIGLSLTAMSSDIPYARSTQTQRAADQYSPAFDWERNSFSSAPGAAVIRDDRFLQTGRSSLQTITNKGSASIIGWAPNPYPFNSYLVGGREDPSALLGGHFVAGQAVQLRAEQNPNDASLQYTRVRQLEKLAVAGLDIGLLRSEGVLPEFNLDVLDGRQYNLVSFATRFSATQEPIVASTTLRRWQANGSSITERMDGALGRLTLIRRGDGVVTSPTPSTGGETLTVQPEPSFIWSNSQYIARHVGRLKLTRDLSGKNQLGAATPSGDLLAFTLDNSDEGQGMLLGVARANSAPSFSSARYQLQGLSLGMTDDANILRQYNDSRLVLNGSSAQLTLKRIAVNHSLAAGTVSDPQDSSFDAVLGGTLNVDAAEHLVRATITVDGSPLALEGFASADQSFIVFRLQHGPHLGLILALRD